MKINKKDMTRVGLEPTPLSRLQCYPAVAGQDISLECSALDHSAILPVDMDYSALLVIYWGLEVEGYYCELEICCVGLCYGFGGYFGEYGI